MKSKDVVEQRASVQNDGASLPALQRADDVVFLHETTIVYVENTAGKDF
jgi:hypothetical protein